MLTVLLFIAVFGRGWSWDNSGTDFTTVFLENIAFYYPTDPNNSLKIITLVPDTLVNISFNGEVQFLKTFSGITILTFSFSSDSEQYLVNSSILTARVVSSNNVVVLSTSQKGDSIQSTIVQPLNKLGLYYTIPSLTYKEMLLLFDKKYENITQIYSSLRLVVVNGEGLMNFITVVKAGKNTNVILDPYAAIQFMMDGTEIAVRSSHKISVMLSHPCAETPRCLCNMLVSPLYPDTQWGDDFPLPSVVNTSNIWLLGMISSNTNNGMLVSSAIHSPDLMSFPSMQFIQTPNLTSLRVISPGFMTELIPLQRFSSCFLVYVESSENVVIVIALREYKDSVYVGEHLLASSAWSPVEDSPYSAVILQVKGTVAVWHPTVKIGVYMFDRMQSAVLYGGPAASITERDPDASGCLLYPTQFTVVSTAMSWPESHQNCMQIGFDLFSPGSESDQSELTEILRSTGTTEEVWIGVRRSLLTLDWYIQEGNDSVYGLAYSEWDTDEPRDPGKGMCASVSPNATMDFLWKSLPCCTKLKSLCFQQALYFVQID